MFLDKCLGRYDVANALRAAGARVEVHHDHFDQDAEDAVWLPSVGAKGWIVLSKDRHFRHNYLELVAMFRGNVRAFVLSATDMTGSGMAQAFVAALPHILSFASKFDPPFVAHITATSNVKMAWHKSQLYRSFSDRTPRK